MYQEPYQAAAAASVAGGYQAQNTQDLSTVGANSLATNVSLSGGGTSTGGVSIGVSGGGGVGGVGGIGNTLFGNSTPTAANIDCVKYPQEF